MKLKVLITALFASLALAACGDSDNSSNNVEDDSNSIDAPATSAPAGTTTPTQAMAEEEDAKDDSKADETDDKDNQDEDDQDKTNKDDEEDETPGAVEQASTDDENPLSAIPRDDLPQACLDYFDELENRLKKFPEASEAAMVAAEELRKSFESMEGDLEQFEETCKDRYEDFKEANAELDKKLEEEGGAPTL